MVFKDSNPASVVSGGYALSQESLSEAHEDNDDVVSSSSDESDGEVENTVEQPVGNSAVELTLVDDDTPLLIFPTEEAGEGDDNTTETGEQFFLSNICFYSFWIFLDK